MSYVLSLCDRTGNMVAPWLEYGVSCVTVDLQDAPSSHPLRRHITADVTTWHWRNLNMGPPSMVFAFPPCTHLAVSGARWWKDKGLSSLIQALTVVEACRVLCVESESPYMLENPIGALATYWRKPDYSFHPVHYSGYAPKPETDEYTKKTCLWVGGGFTMPDRKPGVPTLGSMMHRLPPSDDRADLRSATPMGFANGVFSANSSKLKIAA